MKTHYKQLDFRISALERIMIGLDNSINDFKRKEKELNWYDGISLLEDTEPIFGLGFIALQNYINSSIFDLDDSLIRKTELYSNDIKIGSSGKSRIELIIGLANYFKHRDDNRTLHKGTSNILKAFNLSIESEFDIENSPLFKGIELLNNDWKLHELVKLVGDWRNNLWKN